MSHAKPKHPGGRPPLPPDQRRDVQIATRLNDATVKRIDAIARALGGWPTVTEIVRTSTRLGLERLERDPFLLVDHDAEWAEVILTKCWEASGQLGSAETNLTGDHDVYLSLDEDQDLGTRARSRVSFRDALEKLAAKTPPRRPLPWTSTQAKKQGRAKSLIGTETSRHRKHL